MSDYSNCVAGCKHFTGGEVHHHRDCPNYPESRSERFDEMKAELKKYKKEKRSPLPDGTLPLTEEEFKEFCLSSHDCTSIRVIANKIEIRPFVPDMFGDPEWVTLNDCAAILWLAERFNLEEVCK